MKDHDIENILKQAAGAVPDVDPALLDRVAKSMRSSLHPVRPMPASWILVGSLVAISGAVAIAGSLLLGPHGIRKMSALEIGLIFPVLAALIWIAAALCVAESIPGRRRPVAPGLLALSSSVALAAVFGMLFDDHRMGQFVPQGMKCLAAGLTHAIPVSVGAWWLLHRGFAVDALGAGLARGVLAGLAGVTTLELHCANFEAPHVLVWHIAVIPIAGAAGMLLARIARARI